MENKGEVDQYPEILENLEILESPQTVENKGEADHLLEILENLQSGSKTCHSTKKFPRINFPKYVISTSTRKFPGINVLFQLGDVNFTIFGDLPLGFVLALRSQLKNSFELIFEICHLTFNLKAFWN